MSVDEPIGGFFGLELSSAGGALPPADAIWLRSGRACLRAILETIRPERLVAPFYICDTALAPARALGLPIVFYALDGALRPQLPSLGRNDAVLLVDYFGLCAVDAMALEVAEDHVIVDQTQALFAGRSSGKWYLSSARKWFGVPDGGFLWGPRPVDVPDLRPRSGFPTYLVEKLWGDADRAYREYQASEAALVPEVEPISAASVALLRGVDTDVVRRRRRENFERLSARLGSYNRLPMRLAENDVPFCYPLLPDTEVSRAALASKRIFVPQFWAECERRPDEAFDWERELARSLLPLPIDHRYGLDAMDRLADVVLSTRNPKAS